MDTTTKFSDCDVKNKNLSTSSGNTEYESDELFSDDEQKKEIQYQSEVSQDVTSLSSPLKLLSGSCQVTCNATVPSTPLSLLPFLNKVNDQWTSDLETPQGQPHATSSTIEDTAKETPTFEQMAEVSGHSEIDLDESVSSSPVIVSKTVRRRPKRRIFRSSPCVDAKAVINNENDVNAEVPLASENPGSVILHAILSDDALKHCDSDCVLIKTQDQNNRESDNPTSPSCSLTQEFFKNASFSKIDELCCDNTDKQAAIEPAGLRHGQKHTVENNVERKSDDEEMINIDFTSARGTSCRISKRAVSKAKRLFADVFDADEMRNCELFAEEDFVQLKNKHSTSSTPAKRPLINVAKEEEILAEPETQEQDFNSEIRHQMKLLNIQCDLQTALSTKITEPSFSEVKAPFAEQLHDAEILGQELSEESFAEELNNEPKTRQEIKSPNIRCGFQTARGASIKISQSSLSKAKALFAEHLHDMSDKENLDQELSEEKTFAEESNNKSKHRQEIKSPNIQCGFQTARGASIKISQSSLSKAKALFAENLHDMSDKENLDQELPEEKTFAEESNNKSKNKQEIKSPSIQCGFQTARGASIKISQSSLSKAKTLFAEHLCDVFDQENFELPEEKAFVEEINISKNKQEIKSPNIQCGFQTARGVSIKISQSSLSKAKTLFAEQLHDISDSENFEHELLEEKTLAEKSSESENRREIKSPNIQCGFQTARGASIKISQSSLSKAKTLFAEQLHDISNSENFEHELLEEKTLAEKSSESENRREIKSSSVQCGFQTARGASIKISQSSLSKAKTLFAEQLHDISDSENFEHKLLEEKTLVEKSSESENRREIKSSSVQCGFQTARGASIKISQSSLSKAKTLFAEQLHDIFDSENFEHELLEEKTLVEKSSESENRREIKSSSVQCGFQTARGASIKISQSSLSKAKTLFAEQLHDISNSENFEHELLEEKPLAEKSSEFENRREIKSSSVQCGFQTARGASIKISQSSLSKAKSLFAEQLYDIFDKENFEQELFGEKAFAEELNNESKTKQETKHPNVRCGFQTARGASIKISQSSLSKAKALLAEQLHDISDKENLEQELFDEKVSFPEELNDEFEIEQETKHPSVQCGFQTARGASINISQSSLSRAQALFRDDLDDNTSIGMTCAEKPNSPNKTVRREKENSGFPSSAQTLPRARISFAKRLSSPLESMIAKRNNVFNQGNRAQDAKPPSGIQTARDTSVIPRRALHRQKSFSFPPSAFSPKVNVRENTDHENTEFRDNLTASGIQETAINASLRERARLNVRVDESSPDLVQAQSWLQKRKSSGSDEYTPLGRNREPGRHGSKKARLGSSSEFQARKLFPDEEDADDAADNESRDPENNKQTRVLARSGLESPERDDDAGPSEQSEAASSPIIEAVCRKRKGFGHRNKEKSRSQEYTNEASRGKSDENDEPQVPHQNSAPESGSNTEHSAEYSDTQLMMSFVDQSVKILRDRLAATLEQENAITAKRRRTAGEGSRWRSAMAAGHLYRYKAANASFPLRELGNGAPPAPLNHRKLIERGVQPNVLTVTSATAASYKFQCSDFYGSDVARDNVRGIEMKDGARLIMDENGYVGVWEFQRAFLASPGVDPNLVPARWIENHYRWIVWKLASMDRMRFGAAELPRSLTPSRVMAQLRYRYDREIERSERPALRRILEKDDVASKRMILCVSSIHENNNASPEASPRKGAVLQKWRMELTDGWYSVAACVDLGMLRNLMNGKVKEGTKLVTSGAELLNCDQGCHPLEVTDVCLKLHTNSTRRARWHAKLGYARCSGPIPVELRSVCPNGGLIGKMTVVVARVYPMLYHERTASGDSVIRNAKCEEKAQNKYEQRCWSDIEAFYAKAERDFQGKALPSEDSDGMTIQLNEDYENMSSEDLQRHNELMLQDLRQKEEMFKQQLQSRLRQSLPGPRQVSPLLKVRVCDGNANAILSIWMPGEEIADTLKEGACVSLRNVMASGKRGNELQLTAGRCAIIKPDKRRDTMAHPARAYTPLREITSSEFAPPYGEFDTVGLVCSVGPAPYGMKDFEVAHLAYPKAPASHDTSYLSILFWQGIASYGYADILAVGSVVACANLEWRRASSWNIPAAYCTERSTFTRNPRRNHLYEPFESLRLLITDPIEYAKERTSELNVELQKKATPTRYPSKKSTPIKVCNSASSVDKKLVDFTTPKLGLNVTSNYVPSTSSIQKRLEKLQWYGEAPKLSPLVIRNSKSTSLQFRSPVCVSGENSTEDTSRANQSGNSNTFQ